MKLLMEIDLQVLGLILGTMIVFNGISTIFASIGLILNSGKF